MDAGPTLDNKALRLSCAEQIHADEDECEAPVKLASLATAAFFLAAREPSANKSALGGPAGIY